MRIRNRKFKPCVVDGCNGKSDTRDNMCGKHRSRYKKYGRVELPTLKERILSKIKIDEKTKCWEWQGFVGYDGYGQVGVGQKVKKVHRVMYELHNKDFDKNLCICHRCDNKKCANPSHLFQGTHKDNMVDAKEKGIMRKFGKTKINKKIVDKIRLIFKNSKKTKCKITHVLAKRYNISGTQVNYIYRGLAW